MLDEVALAARNQLSHQIMCNTASRRLNGSDARRPQRTIDRAAIRRVIRWVEMQRRTPPGRRGSGHDVADGRNVVLRIEKNLQDVFVPRDRPEAVERIAVRYRATRPQVGKHLMRTLESFRLRRIVFVLGAGHAAS